MNPQRLLWLFIPLALIGGASLGLYFAWLELAAAPVNATPAELRRSEKEVYIRLVASAYAEEQDVRQARQRLDNLKAGRVAQWVAELALQDELNKQSASAVRLAELAIALDIKESEVVALTEATGDIAQGLSWQLLAQDTLSCAEFGIGQEGMLVIQIQDNKEEPLQDVPIELISRDSEQNVVSLRTDLSGQVIMPLTGAWLMTLSEEESLPINAEYLVEDCTKGEQDAAHAFYVLLKPSDQ
jgi:hypothetical protein